MYNLYTYEKRQKQSEIENIKNLIYSKEYIKKRDKLAKKFYSKINNFLFEMAKKPIIIKNNYYISNQEKLNNSNQIRKFETDRERIEKLLNSQNESQYNPKPVLLDKKYKFNKTIKLNDLVNKNNDSSLLIKNNNNNTNNSTELIYHPSDQTNHTPSDLEIILDTIYRSQELENRKKIVFQNKPKEEKVKKIKIKKFDSKKLDMQQSKLKRYMSNKNIRENNYLKNDEKNLEQKLFLYRQQQKKNKMQSKIKFQRTLRNFKHNENNNTSLKTYFNSIQQAIICQDIDKSYNKYSKDDINKSKSLKSSSSAFNIISQKNNNFSFNENDNNYMNKVKDLLYHKINKKIAKSGNNESNNLNNLSFIENKQKIIEKILKLNKPPAYDKTYQKIKKKDINILKQMAIEEEKKHQKKFNSNIDNQQDSKNTGFYSNYEISHISGLHKKIKSIKNKINKGEIIEDDNLILYNNCVYYKKDKNDMKNLGKIILQKCHFVNNKYNNNENNKLQKGNGKLMITNGLSINEFIDKFALPNLNK